MKVTLSWSFQNIWIALSSKLEKCMGRKTSQRGREIMFLKDTKPGQELYLPLVSGMSWCKFAPLSSCSQVSVWQVCMFCVSLCFNRKCHGLLLQAAVYNLVTKSMWGPVERSSYIFRGWKDCMGKPFPSHEAFYEQDVSMEGLMFRFPHFL